MKSPKNLSHKPIISVNDYEEIDALSANDTDVKALSIGKAQYDEKQISLKVWRHTGQKWSRQSEELPIHRNLDLSILFLYALSPKAVNPQSILVESSKKLTIDQITDIKKIKKYYEENKQFIEPRLKELKQLLNEII
jgi:hypothetical protein